MKGQLNNLKNIPGEKNIESSSSRSYDALTTVAEQTCSEEGVDFNSLTLGQKRAVMFYWCSTCSGTRPIADIIVRRKKKFCRFCGNSIRIYASSNKFGKVRRRVFNKYIESKAAATSSGGASSREGMNPIPDFPSLPFTYVLIPCYSGGVASTTATAPATISSNCDHQHNIL